LRANAAWAAQELTNALPVRAEAETRLALDHQGAHVYLASSSVNLNMTQDRFPDVHFSDTREQSFAA